MRRFLFHGLWLCTGFLFLASGMFCLIYPEITLTSIAIFLGLALVISGINDIISYVNIHRNMTDSGLILMEGIMTILFGLFCLFHHFITAFTIPIIFAIWVIFAGLSRIVSSLDYKQFGFSNWWILLILGILLVILGLICAIHPQIGSIAVS